MAKKNKKAVVDLSNVYKVDEAKGTVKYTVKCHGQYFTGKSKVNRESGDEFDLEKGKRIAKLRAILKMKRAQLTEAIETQSQIREIIAAEPKLNEFIGVLTNSVCQVETKLNAALGIPDPELTPVEEAKE